jgi:hypothetical protein
VPARAAGTSRRRGAVATATLALIGLGLALLLASPPKASANRTDITIFDPPGVGLLYDSEAERQKALDRVQALGADTVRIPANWGNYAPAPHAASQPGGFDPSDPQDYGPHAFDGLDTAIRELNERGIRVLLTPAGPAPRWGAGGDPQGINHPDPGGFAQFVAALGRRYSGSCECGTGSILPRVDFWSVWNEPNLNLYLQPQVVHGQVVSGKIYRSLYLAAQRALEATGHGNDRLLIGETSAGQGSASSDPISFLRTVFCLDANWHRRRGCAPIKADGWAQHPYLPGIPPWSTPGEANYISIGSLDRLTRALRRARNTGATTTRLPVYVTEFGIESYPEPA